MALSSSSSDIHTMDTGIRLPLLVAPSDGGNAILFAVVIADPCPTIQWTVNGTAVSGVGYTLNNPCSSPAGTTSFNFTLTIAATSARTGTYSATLTNPAGTQFVPEVFVTPPGMTLMENYNQLFYCCFLSSAVPVVITELRISSGPRCLLNATSVDIQCVNFGLPRPEIVFFIGTEQVTPGQGSFEHFIQVSFDTVRLSGARQNDGGDYVCEAMRGSSVLNRSQPERLVFCSKC